MQLMHPDDCCSLLKIPDSFTRIVQVVASLHAAPSTYPPNTLDKTAGKHHAQCKIDQIAITTTFG